MRTAALWFVTCLAVALPTACSERDTAPVQVRLADLTRFAAQYDGKRVSTTGVVRSIADPRHYWIEDKELNRVAVHPHSAVSSLTGERVRIVGRYSYSPDEGRLIAADRTKPLDP